MPTTGLLMKISPRLPLAIFESMWQSRFMAANDGINGKTNEQLIEKIIRPAQAASEIIKNHRVEDLIHATRYELGLTSVVYDRLMAAIELGRRIQESRSTYSVIRKINSSGDAIQFCQDHFSRLISDGLQEEFHVVTLNTKNCVIDSHQVSKGTLDASLVHPREVFRVAMKDSASSVLLAHNHPSGDPTPSREDFSVTSRLTEVGRVVGIDVLDHIVMAKGGCKSIREE